MPFNSRPRCLGRSWIQFDFGAPQAIQAVTFALGGPRDPLAQFGSETKDGPVLQSSLDGVQFEPVVRLLTFGAVQHTMSFAPVREKFFRREFTEKAASKLNLGDIDLREMGIEGPDWSAKAQHFGAGATHGVVCEPGGGESCVRHA